MSALDRELLVLHGLTTCRRDAEKVAEAVAELAALRAELEQCRADAERYRWLRGQHWVEPEATFRLGLSETEDAATYEKELDAAIDAARGAK